MSRGMKRKFIKERLQQSLNHLNYTLKYLLEVREIFSSYGRYGKYVEYIDAIALSLMFAKDNIERLNEFI